VLGVFGGFGGLYCVWNETLIAILIIYVLYWSINDVIKFYVELIFCKVLQI
jgi:hypothetical protein